MQSVLMDQKPKRGKRATDRLEPEGHIRTVTGLLVQGPACLVSRPLA